MKWRTLFFILSVLNFFISQLKAQDYNISFKDNKIELISSFLFWSGIHTYDRLRKEEIIDEYKDIDPSKLWRIDKRAISQQSTSADGWSDVTLYTSIAMPLVFTLCDRSLGSKSKQIFWMGLQGYFLENGINELVKILAERPRPFIYRQGEEVLNTSLGKNSTKSFFSGHASTSAYFSFFAAKIFADTHPDSELRPVVWSLAAMLSGTTGFLRYRAGKHFVTDVVAGIVFGASLGIIIPEVYKSDNVSLGLVRYGFSLAFHF